MAVSRFSSKMKKYISRREQLLSHIMKLSSAKPIVSCNLHCTIHNLICNLAILIYLEDDADHRAMNILNSERTFKDM